MYRRLLQQSSRSLRPLRYTSLSQARHGFIRLNSTTTDFESRYATKLEQKAKEAGLGLEELKAKIKQAEQEEARRKREQAEAEAAKAEAASGESASTSTSATGEPAKPSSQTTNGSARNDSSPVKPLSEIFNLQKIMSTPHTPEQVGSLWTAYHLSRSGGTGRGFVCASAPLEAYNKMLEVAERYPAFIIPVPRVQDILPKEGEEAVEGEKETAYEFYFMQWSFHDSPPVPQATEDLFAKPGSEPSPNPRTSTVLFTPLAEYKSRGEFATPYLVLTHYTDLANSHGAVLLRGEITPATGSGGVAADGRYMLNQEDAQILAMTLQKFYLWDGEQNEGQRLLKCFHETPEEFKWEDLLKFAKW